MSANWLLVYQIPAPELIIEFPASGEMYHYENSYGVYSYEEYPEWSVLAGREKRVNHGVFDPVKEAQAEFPDVKYYDGSAYVQQQPISASPPGWFDPAAIGESWDGE